MDKAFIPLPPAKPLGLHWPTPNRTLFSNPERFFATTEANPDYGKPGWTRDCGKRFHRGCDIAPVKTENTGASTRVEFTNCATGEDYLSEQPIIKPLDDVFVVFDGLVIEQVTDEASSSFGKHLVLLHKWEERDTAFLTIYAHLDMVEAAQDEIVRGGQRIGTMGATSNSEDARNWMRIAPHLHFEVWAFKDSAYNPVDFLSTHLKR